MSEVSAVLVIQQKQRVLYPAYVIMSLWNLIHMSVRVKYVQLGHLVMLSVLFVINLVQVYMQLKIQDRTLYLVNLDVKEVVMKLL